MHVSRGVCSSLVWCPLSVIFIHSLFFVVIHSFLTGPQGSYNNYLVLLNFWLVLLVFYHKWQNHTIAESALGYSRRQCNGTSMLSWFLSNGLQLELNRFITTHKNPDRFRGPRCNISTNPIVTVIQRKVSFDLPARQPSQCKVSFWAYDVTCKCEWQVQPIKCGVTWGLSSSFMSTPLKRTNSKSQKHH